VRIVDIDERNVAETGFFCMMSKRESAGYRRKLRWLEARFAEGLRIKLLDLSMGGRGFIEYVPGEYAWRPVEAAGYMFIHCLWVVGKSKGNGYAELLLDRCIADARRRRMKGVAMVTSEGSWLVGKSFLLRHGFESVDRAAPSFELMVRRFGRAAPPSFPDDWERRAKRFGRGLTVVRSDQCPYLENITETAVGAGRERGLKSRVVDLGSSREVRERSPSPYGVWTLLRDGRILSHNYVVKKKLLDLLDDRRIDSK
jgi:hypothetical protein